MQSVEHPYFGASPDEIVYCSCCGPGICEVKVMACLVLVHDSFYCHKDDDMETASDDKNFCLQKVDDGNLKLKTNHQYYYQVRLFL